MVGSLHMKKKILICLVVQLICWSIMTLSDYMEETYNDSYNLVVVFAVPLICVILYIIFRKWIYDNQIVRLKDVAIICAAWRQTGRQGFAQAITVLPYQRDADFTTPMG